MYKLFPKWIFGVGINFTALLGSISSVFCQFVWRQFFYTSKILSGCLFSFYGDSNAAVLITFICLIYFFLPYFGIFVEVSCLCISLCCEGCDCIAFKIHIGDVQINATEIYIIDIWSLFPFSLKSTLNITFMKFWEKATNILY